MPFWGEGGEEGGGVTPASLIWKRFHLEAINAQSAQERCAGGGNFIGVVNNWLSRPFLLPSERAEKQTRSDGAPCNTPSSFFFSFKNARPSLHSGRSWNTAAAHISPTAAPLVALNRREASYLLAYLHYSSFFTPFISSSTLPRHPSSYMRFLPFKGRLQLMCEASCSRPLVLSRL